MPPISQRFYSFYEDTKRWVPAIGGSNSRTSRDHARGMRLEWNPPLV